MPATVAIIGAGPLGRWLALSAARAGFRVLLEDVMPANLHHAQEALRAELGPGGAARTSLFVSTIEDAVREADLAIDCVPDELESKLEILWLLDRMAPPRTVLATPTTRLSIADLASLHLPRRQVCRHRRRGPRFGQQLGRGNPPPHHRPNHPRDHSSGRKFLAPARLRTHLPARSSGQ